MDRYIYNDAATSVRPGAPASPLDMQTEAGRAQAEATRAGRPQAAGAQVQALTPQHPSQTFAEWAKTQPGWYDLPLWQRDQLLDASTNRFWDQRNQEGQALQAQGQQAPGRKS